MYDISNSVKSIYLQLLTISTPVSQGLCHKKIRQNDGFPIKISNCYCFVKIIVMSQVK